MRISDWSSDVCSSDLVDVALHLGHVEARLQAAGLENRDADLRHEAPGAGSAVKQAAERAAGGTGGSGQADAREEGRACGADADRKSVVSGKRVSGRVDLGGRRIIKKKTKKHII